jgi:hypothetical protein
LNGKIDLSAERRGPGGELVRWRRVAATDEGRLELSTLIGDQPPASAYAFVPIVARAGQQAELVIETTSSLQVWLNNQELTDVRRTQSSAGSWFTWRLVFAPGANDLVIRIPSGSNAPAIVSTLVSDAPVEFAFDSAEGR